MKPKTKKPRQKMTLRRETLRLLSDAETKKVRGGAGDASRVIGGKYYPCNPMC